MPVVSFEHQMQVPDPERPSVYSPAMNLRFDRLSAADGLSVSLATSIVQDPQGFMWFGTQYGLNKYDGFNFTVYLLDTLGPNVVNSNFIRALYKDHTGDLWIATGVDLVRRDNKTGEFIHYKPDQTNPQALFPGTIYSLVEDSTGVLWIVTATGLNIYDRTKDTFTRLSPTQIAVSLYSDRQGGMWIGTTRGLLHYTSGPLEGQQPERFRNIVYEPTSLSNDFVTAILEDQQGAIWVGTQGGGLNRLDRATGQFARYKHNPDDPFSLSDNRVTSILEDNSGRLWVGTLNGLNVFDRTTGRFFVHKYDPADLRSLGSNVVQDIYQDRSGVVWIATLTDISKVNEIASHFTYYGQRSIQADSQAGAATLSRLGLSDHIVTDVYQDRQGILWVGTSLGGLNRLDRDTGSLTVYQYDPAEPAGINAGEVSAIYEDRAGTLWIGTSSGLSRYDAQMGTFVEQIELRGDSIVSITEDQQGSLWVGHSGGILRRAPGSSAFSVVPSIRYLLTGDQIRLLYSDRTGAVWISTQNDGLYRLGPEMGVEGSLLEVTHFPQNPNDSHSPGVSPVTSFYEDSMGTLWMGSLENGLIRFDRDSQSFIHYIPDTGPASYVSCIQGDAQGFLWMGTRLGLARFDPLNQTFLFFDARDGLIIGEGLSCAQNEQGEMFFGSLQGLVTFFPEEITDNPNPPEVVITALNLNNQPLHTDLLPDEQIELSYSENNISFDFAALDYAAPSKNQYAYRMEGLDTGWIEAGIRRHADYPDLKPGTYTFRVKASNNSGVWNEQGAAVHITITPPFWQTWWFLGTLGVALVGIIAGGVRLRLRGVEARSRDLEWQVSQRTGDLEQKTLELQLRTMEIEHRRQELEALLSADDRMQRCLYQDQILKALVDVAVDILRADKSAVFWWDEKRQNLVLRVGRGFREQAAIQLQFARDVGIVSRVALSGVPELVEDSLTDPRRNLETPQHVQFAMDEGIRSFMFFPITIGNEVVGVFNVSYTKPHAAGEEEQRLFQALTQRAALHIENVRLYEQSQELAVLEERSRLARELHDAVTQTLFSASLVAEALPATWEKDPQEGRGLLQELRSLSRGALAEMRTLLLELRPAALLETSLSDLLRQLGEAASGRTGIPIIVQVEGHSKLPPDVHIAFYRIAQEALNNVVKHAHAHQAVVRIYYRGKDQAALSLMAGQRADGWADQSVLLSIRDDGRGFNHAEIPHDRLGIGIMQERAQEIGAHLTVESQPGYGTQVTILWEQAEKQEAL